MENWRRLKDLVKEEQYQKIHKMVWEDFIIITDEMRTRYKIPADAEPYQVRQLMNNIKEFGVGISIYRGFLITKIVILSSLLLIFNLN